MRELPFHQDALAAALQHRHANRAAADIHRHLETQGEKISREAPARFLAALVGVWVKCTRWG